MNRRNFIRTLIGGVVAGAAVRTWPFRIYSFPSEIVRRPWPTFYPKFDPAKHIDYRIILADSMDIRIFGADIACPDQIAIAMSADKMTRG